MGVDIIEFLEIEKKYDLYHLEVEGVQCWQYIRFRFWNYKICSMQLGLSSSSAKQGKASAFLNVLGSLSYILLHPDKRKLRQADICFVAHERRTKSNGQYECLYTDRLKESWYPDAITLEKPFRMQHLRPVRTKNLYYTDLNNIKGSIKCQIQIVGKTSHYRKVYREVHRLFGSPLDEIIQKYHLELEKEEIERQLAKTVLECQVLKKCYGKCLDIIKPKVIIEVVGYAKLNMILNELAKEKGIITIELQHGTMHGDHAAYQYAKGCGVISQFPDVLFLFSDYWKHCIHVPIKDDAIKVVGYPYFEQKLQQYPKTAADEKERILFISQGTIGIELSKLAAETAALLDGDKYRIIYKLHPEEYAGWRERCPWLCSENIEVIDSLEHNIYEYFSICNIQVGVYSTAVYEGLGFGLRTFIYRIGHADTMKELCSQGYGSFVSDASELVRKITDSQEKGKKCPELFWKREALQNMKNEIEQYI